MTFDLEDPLRWPEVAAIARGASLTAGRAALARVAAGRARIETLIERGVRAYGVNTGVGALCEVVVARADAQALARNIVMSHAIGTGPALPAAETRAVLAASANNLAHGASGVRPRVLEHLLALLAHDCLPELPAGGSVGYLTHMAHAALVLIGAGHAQVRGERLPGAAALAAIGLEPLVLEAKEGLSLVNGTPCATGLACVALERARRLLDWADVAAALSFETLGGQLASQAGPVLALRRSVSLDASGARLRALLAGSERLAARQGQRTQDALSLRAIPHVHATARDSFEFAAARVDTELQAVTDNPVITGTLEVPEVWSEAHAVGAALAHALDQLAIALAGLGAMAERRIDRLVNPLVSGLPAFLAAVPGVSSGLMIAQYTAVSLVGENRRLAAPASLDGGITSGQQEDLLTHATPAATKLLRLLDNLADLVAIELLSAAQADELLAAPEPRAPATAAVQAQIRARVPPYHDDRPLAEDLARVRGMLEVPAPGADPAR